MTLHTILSLILVPAVLLVGPMMAQDAPEDSTAWGADEYYDFRAVVGVSGVVSFVNPEQLNDQLAFTNSSFDASMEKVRNMYGGRIFFRIKPRILSQFFLVGAEVMMVERSFDYVGLATTALGDTTGRFTVSNSTRWSVYPVTLGIGATIPKLPIDIELGVIYALGYITETTDIEGHGSSTHTYDGDGWGFIGRISPRLMMTTSLRLTVDLAYRSLTLSGFTDDLGRPMKEFELRLNGMVFGVGVMYTF